MDPYANLHEQQRLIQDIFGNFVSLGRQTNSPEFKEWLQTYPIENEPGHVEDMYSVLCAELKHIGYISMGSKAKYAKLISYYTPEMGIFILKMVLANNQIIQHKHTVKLADLPQMRRDSFEHTWLTVQLDILKREAGRMRELLKIIPINTQLRNSRSYLHVLTHDVVRHILMPMCEN